MMHPTMNLRYVHRYIGTKAYRILQQQWTNADEDPDKQGGAIEYEWRDVPVDIGATTAST